MVCHLVTGQGIQLHALQAPGLCPALAGFKQRTAHTFAPAFGHNHQIAEIGESSRNQIVFLLLCLLFPNAGKTNDLSQILCQKDLLIFL